jgi:hypothetical protein
MALRATKTDEDARGSRNRTATGKERRSSTEWRLGYKSEYEGPVPHGPSLLQIPELMHRLKKIGAPYAVSLRSGFCGNVYSCSEIQASLRNHSRASSELRNTATLFCTAFEQTSKILATPRPRPSRITTAMRFSNSFIRSV